MPITFLVEWAYSLPAEHPYGRQIGRGTAEFGCFTAAHDFALDLELRCRRGIRIRTCQPEVTQPACHAWVYDALSCAELRMDHAYLAKDWDRYDSERVGVIKLRSMADAEPDYYDLPPYADPS